MSADFLTHISVNQSGAGTTVLAAGATGKRHKLIGCVLVMSAAGSLKFTDTTDLTGPMDIVANGGFVLPATLYPYLATASGAALNLVTTVGAARGVVTIVTEN